MADFKRLTLQAAAAATGNGTAFDVAGFGTSQLQVTGTFVGTVTFESTIDYQNWVTQEVEDTNGARQTTATATGIFKCDVAGLAAIRARVSAYTSGSITVEGIATKGAAVVDSSVVIGAGTANIGDVDVLSVVPGTGATNLGKAIDTAAGATDTGVAPLAQRDDALSALSPVEGDYVPLRTDANGALWTHDDALDAALSGSELQVDIVAALPAGTNAIGKLAANSGVDIGDVDVTSLPALPAGTNNIGDVDVLSVVPGTDATNLGKAADAVAGATDTGVAPLAVRDDALGALTPVEGDYVPLRTDANGALWTHDDALDAALAGSELQVDIVAALPAGTNAIGKLAANSGVDIGDVDVLSLPALAAGTNNIGDVDVLTIAAGDNNIGNVDIVTIAAGATLVGDVGVAGRATGGGTSIYSAAVTSAAAVKASAGQVYAIDIFNTTAAVAYLQVFNIAAASVTLGTTAPTYSIGLPASASKTLQFVQPIVHGTAIAVAGTTTRTGASTAGLDVNIVYA